MSPKVRRTVLTVHVLCSVGWIGAAAAYLAVAVATELATDAATVRAGWISMELMGWWIIVPLGGLAFVTGLIMSLGTSWGLVRHYWVLFALALTAVSFALLVLHMPSVSVIAGRARSLDDTAVLGLGGDVMHPALGVVVLVVIAVLNMYKPRGATGLGRRRGA